MQAVNNIEKGELMELRSMKTPSELAVQVLEAVCVLLGVKADWNAAKMLMADSQFIQKLLDFDKDNVNEQASKRIRRYIDNPPRTLLNMFWVLLVEIKLLYKKWFYFESVFRGNL